MLFGRGFGEPDFIMELSAPHQEREKVQTGFDRRFGKIIRRTTKEEK